MLSFPAIGTLGQLAVGDKIKITRIKQDLPEEKYIGENLKKMTQCCLEFFQEHTTTKNREYNFFVKLNKPGRRYLVIERLR